MGAFTGRQWTDASWEEETVAFVVMRAEPSQQWWIKQLGRVCVHKEEKQKH